MPRSEPHNGVPCQDEPANAWSKTSSSKRMRRSICLTSAPSLRSHYHVVVQGPLIEAAQELPCLGGHDRDLVVLACEGPDGVERLEQRQCRELHAVREVPAEQIRARVSVHPMDAGEDLRLEERFVGVRVLAGRGTVPQSSDHWIILTGGLWACAPERTRPSLGYPLPAPGPPCPARPRPGTPARRQTHRCGLARRRSPRSRPPPGTRGTPLRPGRSEEHTSEL